MRPFFLIMAMSIGFMGCAASKKIYWTGSEVSVGVGDQYIHNVGWLENTELGLREDGVMVWRKKK